MDFPAEFANRIKEMLGSRSDEFFTACELPVFRGLRVNPLKADADKLMSAIGGMRPSPFCDTAFYIPDSVDGNHPLHHAGAFYIQEPSASSAVECMGIEQGDRVLDLCAAPGGKTTQIAGKLMGSGLIVANEYSPSRVRPLVSNIERLGVTNAVVTNCRPDELVPTFAGYFDRILVDAPCSGEGMFRKEPEALNNWSIENSRSCGERQLKILDSAAGMLKNGGVLVYSTCTFSPFENEQVISRFVASHGEFLIEPLPLEFGTPGIAKEAPDTPDIVLTRHIFPFDGGEGHFVARLRKNGESNGKGACFASAPKATPQTNLFLDFLKHNFALEIPTERIVSVGEKVYITTDCPSIRAVRNGVFAGEARQGRFEPSHALYSAYGKSSLLRVDLNEDSEELARYLHGDEIPCDTSKGFAAVLVDGIPLSFGKVSDGKLKNHYPKGLRRLA